MNLDTPDLTRAKSGISLIACDPEQACEIVELPSGEIESKFSTARAISLVWKQPPRKVLIIQKRGDSTSNERLKTCATWLKSVYNLQLYAEPEVVVDFPFLEAFTGGDMCDSIDFVICIGGDGTILHANALFPHAVPPLMAFHSGSLGFLTTNDFSDYQQCLSAVLAGHVPVTVRMRLRARIVRSAIRIPTPVGQIPIASGAYMQSSPRAAQGDETEFHVLNEVVLDRGPSPYIVDVNCFCNAQPFTTVMADGVIISTPTGSTGYSLSAGGSMVHPQLPAILLTPICPHSLSFRPVVLPDSVELKLEVPASARASVWVSFDGRKRQELRQGDAVVITMSKWPLACLTDDSQQSSWLSHLADRLHWNIRERQKSFSAL
eukprot:TRINITY_DN253_c0_g1_i2.p1 TRINITY_DN253_c0_g1~~TRINITY_DN253_c0_g1_i2.p1  ORF type:complete len:377 (+),score=52.32 TRINITY_DN253_c0_g1_i2:52-1182(+)